MTLRILALDPATNCGAAHTSGYRATWHLQASDGEHRGLRLVRLRQAIHDVARTLGVDLIAFENACLGAGKRQMSVTVFHGQVQGAILMAAAELGVAVLPCNPTAIKRFATGAGNADKAQMIAAARTQLGVETTDDNIADACWVLEFAKHQQTRLLQPKARQLWPT